MLRVLNLQSPIHNLAQQVQIGQGTIPARLDMTSVINGDDSRAENGAVLLGDGTDVEAAKKPQQESGLDDAGHCVVNKDRQRRSTKRSYDGSKRESKPRLYQVGSRLKETDIGVTEFVSDHAPISGILKDRYTDFQVNEIGYDGQVAKLTNQDIPSLANVQPHTENPKVTVSEEVRARVETLSELNAPCSPIEVDVTDMDKAERRAIHELAKQLANVISETIDKDGRKIIVIKKNEGGNNHGDQRSRGERRINWKGREYCYFLLHKMNIGTMHALNRLAASMRLRPDSFAYAGTKDRRAWTTQWVSLKRIPPAAVLKAARSIRGLYVGNFRFEAAPLKLGSLGGNRFRIALRNVTAPDELIEEAMNSLRDNGFINYYGLQRFGTVALIPTYEIGKKLLQGQWNEAIELILKPRDGEYDVALAEARAIYDRTKDPEAACRKLKEFDTIEAKLLRGLCSAGKNNPQGALDYIPRNARLMYIHAYQSFVWNHMVSRRIREFGKRPIVGDLVYRRQDDRESNEAVDFADLDSCVDETDESETQTCRSKEESTDATSLPEVKALGIEDLENYSLSNVLMPQPGWKVIYPEYAKSWFEEFLTKDGLSGDFRRKNIKYSLSGTYRKMLQMPSNVSWKTVRYTERNDELIRPDIHEMRNPGASELTGDQDGKYKALLIEMSLPSSTYATMALRELLKQDTSAEVQAARSAAHDVDEQPISL